MYKPLSIQRKKNLLNEFRNLETVNAKFDFWKQKFKTKYIEYLIWKNPSKRVHHPELIPDLPRDVVALEWGYEAGHPFDDHLAKLKDK